MFHGHICSLSLSLSLSLSRRRIQKILTLTTFLYFDAVVDAEEREDPNTTKVGLHQPASERHLMALVALENIGVNFRGIAMGLSPAGKGLTSWLSFVVSSVSLSLSHWYPGSGVVLDCIDS